MFRSTLLSSLQIKLYDSLIKIDKWKWKAVFLILFSILVKWIYFFIIHSLYSNNSPHLFNLFVGDDKVYMEFCENFYNKGVYFIKTGESFDYTFRMPAFNFLYYPLRLFLSKELTMDGIIIIQTTLSGLACYFLAKISQTLFNSKKVFYFVYALTCFGFLNSFYNNQLMRESLAFSSIIFTVYFMLKGIESKRKTHFILAGFFMTWLIFLRPYVIVLYAVLFCVILIYIYKKKVSLKSFILYNLIFTVLISLWTYRNFVKTGSFIPLESSISWANELQRSKLDFIKVFGFQCETWIPNTQSNWLDTKKANLDIEQINQIFPKRTFNGDLTIDSLIKLKKVYNNSIESLSFNSKPNSDKQEALRLFNKFEDELKKERPFDYYFFNRLRIVKSFLRENTYTQFTRLKYPLNVLGVFTETFYNIGVKLFGIFGLILIAFKYYKNYLILATIVFFPAFILFFFPIYSGIDETRFFFLTTPFLMISSAYLIEKLLKKNKFKLSYLVVCLLIPFFISIQKVTELIHF